MTPALVVLLILFLACLLGFTARFSSIACVLWILALETSPDEWLDRLIGEHETIIAVMKLYGLLLVAVLALRHGLRRDRYNPSLAFGAMFAIGLMHGLYPGLGLLASARGLVGSAAPFLFSFVRLQAPFIRAVKRAVVWGPLAAVAFGGVLAATGLDQMYSIAEGAIRLGGSGEPPFLAGFALTAIYAGLLEYQHEPRRGQALLVLVNFSIILLTGARMPLAIAVLFIGSVLLAQRRFLLLAAAGAAGALGVMFLSAMRFLRVADLARLGQAMNLSNRNIVWPYFESAIGASPWVGWGVGAGKVIIPYSSHLDSLLGTNAAHDEYLRIGAEGGLFGLALLIALFFLWARHNTAHMPGPQAWLMRLIFVCFALHAATDNTLIATTSSVLFLWVSAAFATPKEASKPPG